MEDTQIVEGGSDSQAFENFLYRLMNSIRRDPKTKDKEVIIFMDNARTHKTEQVQALSAKLGFVLLYSAQYSPWLQPVEQLCNHLKQELKRLSSRPLK